MTTNRDQVRARNFAGKWKGMHLNGWISDDVTDEALERAFAGCVLPPKRDLYPLIRAEIADYGNTAP